MRTYLSLLVKFISAAASLQNGGCWWAKQLWISFQIAGRKLQAASYMARVTQFEQLRAQSFVKFSSFPVSNRVQNVQIFSSLPESSHPCRWKRPHQIHQSGILRRKQLPSPRPCLPWYAPVPPSSVASHQYDWPRFGMWIAKGGHSYQLQGVAILLMTLGYHWDTYPSRISASPQSPVSTFNFSTMPCCICQRHLACSAGRLISVSSAHDLSCTADAGGPDG